MTHASNSYTAEQAMEDLWKLDAELTGTHQQTARNAWVRLHNFIMDDVGNASPPTLIEQCREALAPRPETSPAAKHLAEQLEQEADEITCYASTMDEYRQNRTAALMREAAKIIRLNVLMPPTGPNGKETAGRMADLIFRKHGICLKAEVLADALIECAAQSQAGDERWRLMVKMFGGSSAGQKMVRAIENELAAREVKP